MYVAPNGNKYRWDDDVDHRGKRPVFNYQEPETFAAFWDRRERDNDDDHSEPTLESYRFDAAYPTHGENRDGYSWGYFNVVDMLKDVPDAILVAVNESITIARIALDDEFQYLIFFYGADCGGYDVEPKMQVITRDEAWNIFAEMPKLFSTADGNWM